MALVASRPWSPLVLPLLCGPRALGQCPSILLGMLPGFKCLSILKEGDGMERPTQSWLSTGQSPTCPSAWILGGPPNQKAQQQQGPTLLHAKESAVARGTMGGGKGTAGFVVFFCFFFF